jgi:hypothetical protein
MVMRDLQTIDYSAFIKIMTGKCRSQEREQDFRFLSAGCVCGIETVFSSDHDRVLTHGYENPTFQIVTA